jgi:hypothetical protein
MSRRDDRDYPRVPSWGTNEEPSRRRHSEESWERRRENPESGRDWNWDSERSMMGRYIGKGPRNYTRSDERIVEDVSERLTEDHMIDASEIEVSCQNGEVTLTGTVESRLMKRTAEDIADEVWGVRDVHNQIRLRQPSNDRSDRVA